MKRNILIGVLVITVLFVFFSFKLNDIVSHRGERAVNRVNIERHNIILSVAKSHKDNKDYEKALRAYNIFLESYPDSKKSETVLREIGDLKVKMIFSDRVSENQSSLYEIKSGDTLTGIAKKFNTTVELIKKSNNLSNDLIMPGKKLKINRAKYNIFVDKSDNILKLSDENGQAIKVYTVSTGENMNTPTGEFKIEEKLVRPVWYKVGAVVSPESKEYELGSRWMGLSVAGYGIHGTNDSSTIGKHITKGCVRMKNEDVEELYAIVPSGTKVLIVD